MNGVRRVQLGDMVGFRYLIKDEHDVVLAASTELVRCVHGESSLGRGIENDMKGRICGETFTTLGLPFAGKSIWFQISIVSIRIATLGELGGASGLDSGLGAELMELRVQLDNKFSAESAPGGLFEELVDEDFTTVRRVNVLRGEQSTLLSQLDVIIAQVRAEGLAYDYRPALLRLVRRVARHDRTSANMMSESVNRDTGGEG